MLSSMGIVLMAMVVPTFRYGIQMVTSHKTLATNKEAKFLIPIAIPSDNTPWSVILCAFIVINRLKKNNMSFTQIYT